MCEIASLNHVCMIRLIGGLNCSDFVFSQNYSKESSISNQKCNVSTTYRLLSLFTAKINLMGINDVAHLLRVTRWCLNHGPKVLHSQGSRRFLSKTFRKTCSYSISTSRENSELSVKINEERTWIVRWSHNNFYIVHDAQMPIFMFTMEERITRRSSTDYWYIRNFRGTDSRPTES